MDAKRTFLIAQTVELAAENEVHRYEQPLEYGDGNAHEWRVTVRRNREAVYLDGVTAKCMITRPANAAEREKGYTSVTVIQDASICAAAGMISCVLNAACYAGMGRVKGVMKLIGADGESVTVARMTAGISRDTTEAISDPEDLVPGIEKIVAVLGEADSAADEARDAAAEARYMAQTMEGWENVQVAAETMAAGSAAAVVMTDENGVRTITFYIPAGVDGRSFVVKGRYASLSALQTAHPTGEEGDAYAVGTASSNNVYIWDVDAQAWASVGKLQGPQGIQGIQGKQGQPGADGAKFTQHSVVVPASGWTLQEDGTYAQTVAIDGVLDIDLGYAFLDMSAATKETGTALQAAWALIGRTETADGGVTLTCYGSAPEIDVSILLGVFR